jgi:hypothetical protein
LSSDRDTDTLIWIGSDIKHQNQPTLFRFQDPQKQAFVELEGSVGAHTPGNPHRMKSSGRWWGWGGFELQGASKSEKRELEIGDQWNFL